MDLAGAQLVVVQEGSQAYSKLRISTIVTDREALASSRMMLCNNKSVAE